MTTVLVANRGEVAVRVLKTVRKMGLRGVAVYSDADADQPFVKMADAAVRIGPAPASESYLLPERIIDAAAQLGAELVHPGYGFLSEDPRFADACEKAGLVFVGPPPSVLRLMGAKDEAKRVASEAGAPVLPGYSGPDQSDAAFAEAAAGIGYPVIVKPVAGGGGKGMAVVAEGSALAAALASARRTGVAAFDDDRLMIEKYLEDPRHVEVQILADSHGNVVHLGERDCSAQRRHQKVLEESPSPSIDERAREALTAGAVGLARAAGYRNAGTCEFIVGADGTTAAFMEMNARLQVEHPVTEMVTGLDLVELQIKIAMGEPLPMSQSDITYSGHAAETRLYAEDPAAGFLPQAGRIVHLRWPSAAEGLRIDTGVEEGSEVSAHYDPMIAKVIVHAPDRASCIERLHRALSEIEILGLQTNLGFLQQILLRPEVLSGSVTTSLLEKIDVPGPDAPPDEAFAIAAAARAGSLRERGAGDLDPWASFGAFRIGGTGGLQVILTHGNEDLAVETIPLGAGEFSVAGRRVREGDGPNSWMIDGRSAAAVPGDEGWHVWWDGRPYLVGLGPRIRTSDTGSASRLEAPMPGQVLSVKVHAGEAVTKGQVLVVVEAMKMEHAIRASADGTVKAVLCAEGDQVDRGATLVDIEPV